MEDKFEDEEEMRDRARALTTEGFDHDTLSGSRDVDELMSLAKQHGEFYKRPKVFQYAPRRI